MHIDFWGLAIASIVAPIIVGAVLGIGGWMLRNSLLAIRHQVENSRGTNLRDDLDVIRKDIGGLRSEVRAMRAQSYADMRAVEGRVNARVDQILRSPS